MPYQDDDASNIVTTPTRFTFRSARPCESISHGGRDPQLLGRRTSHGKKDLIPGHPTLTGLQADQAGNLLRPVRRILRTTSMRRCASRSSCRTRRNFEAWLEAARQPAAPPTNRGRSTARHVSWAEACSMCHTITGHRSRRSARAGSDARRQPHDARRRIVAEFAGTSGGLDHRSAADQARRAHAAAIALGRTICRRCWNIWRA